MPIDAIKGQPVMRKCPGLHANELAVRIGGEEGRLFHFFHGDFSTGGLFVPRFAAMLRRDRPILAIAPHGINGERVPASIEEMAADRLPLILEAQPRGPYVLGGHCNGALVAFETARLLVNVGHRVDLVVMIDPVVVSVRRSARLLLLALDLTKRVTGIAPDLRWRSLELAWERLAEIENRLRLWNKSWAEWWDAIGWRWGRGLRTERPAGFKETESLETGPAKPSLLGTWEDPEVLGAYCRAMLVYHPSRLAVPILYIALRYSGGAWRRISPDIELIDVDVPRRYHASLSGDFAAGILGRVRARLDALDAFTKVSAGA